MSAIRDWEEIRDRWSRDFENVVDGLNMALDEKVSTPTKNQLELAVEIVKEHQKVILEVVHTLKRMDRRLHGIDIAAESPGDSKERRLRRS